MTCGCSVSRYLGINISYLGKRKKSSSKVPSKGDMLGPSRVGTWEMVVAFFR